MAAEYAINNIIVNAILPAVVDEGMSKEMRKDDISKQLNLMGKQELIQVKNVSSLVNYLLSGEQSNLTGQLLRLDNGMPL